MSKGFGATDVVVAGSTNVSILFALDVGGLTITDLKLDWVRFEEGTGASFVKPSRVTYPLALTELTTYDSTHSDGKGKFIDTDSSGGLQRLLRVDFPDEAFAIGKHKVVCNILDDGNDVVGQRIIDLRGNDSVYSNGAVWIDMANGTTPSTALNYKHGTPADPLNNLPQAKAIADSLGMNRFQVVGPKGQLLLATPDYSEGYEFISDGLAKIHLGYATLTDCAFKCCHINSSNSGVTVGAGKFHMTDCLFGEAVTLYLPRVSAHNCSAYGIIELVSTGVYEFAGLKCVDTQVTIDLGSAIGAQTLLITGFSGKLNLKNIKAGDAVVISGDGEVRLDASCTSGTIRLVGPIYMDNASAGTVITNYTTNHIVWDELAADHVAVNTFGAYLDSKISLVAGAVWAVGTRTLTSFGTLAVDTATAVWTSSTRTLTSFGTLVSDIWTAGTRTLTSFGTLVADIATAVWASSTRTLTSFGTLASDVWAVGTRTLTSYGTLVADISTSVWGAGTRTLTSFGTLAVDTATAVWVSSTRTLTSFGTLVADTASAVWASGARTLTSFGTLVADIATAVWGAGTRTLTSFGTLVVDIASSVWSGITRTLTGIGSSGIASETNATANRNILQGEHVALHAEHSGLDLKSTDIQSRLPATLQGGRMRSNLDAIGGSATVDGTSLLTWAELVQAMVNGRFKKDFPVAGQLTIYKRDNLTVLTVLNVTDTERTRIS